MAEFTLKNKKLDSNKTQKKTKRKSCEDRRTAGYVRNWNLRERKAVRKNYLKK